MFYYALAEYLDDPHTALKRLVLEGNKMGDSNLKTICKVLEDNTKVTYISTLARMRSPTLG